MTKRCTTFLSFLLVLAFSLPVLAQGGSAGKSGGDEATGEDIDLPPEAAPDTPTDDDLKTTEADVAPTQPVLTTGKRVESRRTWEDIVVIPRKPFIKAFRFDLTPTFMLTVGDNIIEHYSLGLEANFHISDVLSIGLVGQYYFKDILDQEFWTRYHYSRVPAINKYIYSAYLQMAYVPIYGKIALFNDKIFHYEAFLSAGIGVSGTEIVPKDYQYEVFSNPAILTFPIGGGLRFFVNKFFAIQAGIKAYLMIDKYEGPRGIEEAGKTEVEVAQANAKTRFIANGQFFLGLSFYLPPNFEYTTFR